MTPYEDLASPLQMHADCEATGRTLGLESPLARAARVASRPAPSLHYADFPREVAKREIRVSEAATRIANALHLHLD